MWLKLIFWTILISTFEKFEMKKNDVFFLTLIQSKVRLFVNKGYLILTYKKKICAAFERVGVCACARIPQLSGKMA